MTHSLIEDVFAGRSRLAVLRCLHASPGALTGREVSRRSGFSHQQAHVALRALTTAGVVESVAAGSARLFRLNRKHWLVSDVIDAVFGAEKKWLAGLLREASSGLPAAVQSLVLFGSAARGGLRPASDIDLLALVRRAGDKKAVMDFFSGRAAAILERYRFPLAPVVLTVDEFRALYRAKDDFARTILKTGSIVKGKLLTEIL
jgi:predicted nucleotidyltransferase/DNA-binding transcriptional ArsR family regulator